VTRDNSNFRMMTLRSASLPNNDAAYKYFRHSTQFIKKKSCLVLALHLSTLLNVILNSLCISSPSIMQQIVFSPFHFHLTHVSDLHGHLQVSESVKTATLHQCAFTLVKTTPHATGGNKKQGTNYSCRRTEQRANENKK
jgi:hypothetical protein